MSTESWGSKKVKRIEHLRLDSNLWIYGPVRNALSDFIPAMKRLFSRAISPVVQSFSDTVVNRPLYRQVFLQWHWIFCGFFSTGHWMSHSLFWSLALYSYGHGFYAFVRGLLVIPGLRFWVLIYSSLDNSDKDEGCFSSYPNACFCEASRGVLEVYCRYFGATWVGSARAWFNINTKRLYCIDVVLTLKSGTVILLFHWSHLHIGSQKSELAQ